MKKLVLLFLMCVFAAAAAAQQSVAEAARARRAEKTALPPARQFNDDTMPAAAAPSVSQRVSAKMEEEAAAARAAEVRQAQRDEVEAQKRWRQYLQKQIELEEQEIALLQRELNVARGEAGLMAAAYYGDAGVMLRFPEQYFAAARAQLEEMSYKKQELADARQRLADLQELERKARAGLLFASKSSVRAVETGGLRNANDLQLARQSGPPRPR